MSMNRRLHRRADRNLSTVVNLTLVGRWNEVDAVATAIATIYEARTVIIVDDVSAARSQSLDDLSNRIIPVLVSIRIDI